jgi:hypothetical protein
LARVQAVLAVAPGNRSIGRPTPSCLVLSSPSPLVQLPRVAPQALPLHLAVQVLRVETSPSVGRALTVELQSRWQAAAAALAAALSPTQEPHRAALQAVLDFPMAVAAWTARLEQPQMAVAAWAHRVRSAVAAVPVALALPESRVVRPICTAVVAVAVVAVTEVPAAVPMAALAALAAKVCSCLSGNHVQRNIRSSPAFKRRWTHHDPANAERPTGDVHDVTFGSLGDSQLDRMGCNIAHYWACHSRYRLE